LSPPLTFLLEKRKVSKRKPTKQSNLGEWFSKGGRNPKTARLMSAGPEPKRRLWRMKRGVRPVREGASRRKE